MCVVGLPGETHVFDRNQTDRWRQFKQEFVQELCHGSFADVRDNLAGLGADFRSLCLAEHCHQ